ncbi:MAG: PQQ-binding-like beta-propeller repeat protein [Planctomycetes bacterium]|nr:PQQ-binding-like beta-propeller repeat protein [Planctomycetota bacterium]
MRMMIAAIVVWWLAFPRIAATHAEEPGGGARAPRAAGPAEEMNDVADGLRADDTYGGVYLDDSFEAVDGIAQAAVLAERGRWVDAARTLQAISDTAGNKLVRLDAGYYVGLRAHVSEIIAGWPGVGLDAYRSLFEKTVRDAVRALSPSRDMDELLILCERYFCTSSAAELADTLGQRALESGDLALADGLYRRVLESHPDRATYESRFGSLLLLIAVMRGDDSAIAKAPPDATMRWMGQRLAVADVLSEAAETFSDLKQDVAADDWPIFGGNTQRNRMSTTTVDEPGLLWRFDDLIDEQRLFDVGYDRLERDLADDYHLSINPVVSGGRVFVQFDRSLLALDGDTGALVWRYGKPRPGAGERDAFEEYGANWHAPTVHEGYVYAVLPGDPPLYSGVESIRYGAELVCVSVDSGRERWRASEDTVGPVLRQIAFDSSPLVAHGRLYVVGRRQRSFGFEDCYLFQFDAKDGSLRARTHVGSASTGTFGSRQATTTIPALAGDVVYVCTNLGSLAAVSAHTGAVRWLRLYERDLAAGDTRAARLTRDVRSWHYSPTIYANGRIYAFPSDSSNILILDATDGRITTVRKTADLGSIHTWLGFADGIVCGTGRTTMCADPATGTPVWTAILPNGAEPLGRGMWAGDRLFVPTADALSVFRVEDGKRTDVAWDAEERGGNVLALPDRLVVAGARSVSVYVRKADIFDALRAEMAAAPDSPEPALDLVEAAFRAKEFGVALEAIDHAVERSDLVFDSGDPETRSRMMVDVLRFVTVPAALSRIDRDDVERLFGYAARLAQEEAAHVDYRFAFAEVFSRIDAPERSLSLYNQVLRDRALRATPLTGDATSFETAGRRAEREIARLIEQHGAGIYARFDDEAQRWLESATAADDADLLERVVETFPNSSAAPDALVALGETLARSGHPEKAAHRFAAAYQRYPKAVDRPRLLRRIADAYERAGKLVHAYRWLTKAARAYPDTQIQVDGTAMSFVDYRARLADVGIAAEPARPSIELPIDHHRSREFDDEVRLLEPRFDAHPRADWSAFYVLDGGAIRAFSSTTSDERWPRPVPLRGAVNLLIATNRVVVFATDHEIIGVDPGSGERIWSEGELPSAVDEANADWEGPSPYRRHAVSDGRLVSVRDDGRMSCLTMADGEAVWPETRHPVPAGPVAVDDRMIAYHRVRDGRAIICLVDAVTGRWVGEIAAHGNRPIQALFTSLDGQIIVATSLSIAAYDAELLKERWHVALGGHLRDASLVMDIDALYLSRDGRSVQKHNLEDGREVWRSDRIGQRADDALTVDLQGGYIIVSSRSTVVALDPITGLTLWEGTTPEQPHFPIRLVTDRYVAAIHNPHRGDLEDSAAIFYDWRGASGLVPRNGGALPLGRLIDVRGVLAVDGALVIQAGSVIHHWSRR